MMLNPAFQRIAFGARELIHTLGAFQISLELMQLRKALLIAVPIIVVLIYLTTTFLLFADAIVCGDTAGCVPNDSYALRATVMVLSFPFSLSASNSLGPVQFLISPLFWAIFAFGFLKALSRRSNRRRQVARLG